MRRLPTLFLPPLAALLLGLGACSRTDDAVALGKGYFTGVGCANCHAVGPGGPTTGTNLAFVGIARSPEWLDLWLKDPRAWKKDTLMPDTDLSSDVRGKIVAYLGTLKGQAYAGGGAPWDTPELKADPVKRGEAIYLTVGCAACHGKKGVGGYPNNNVKGGLVPGLDQASAGYTKEELKKRIRLGAPKPQKADPKGPDPLLRMPAWGDVLDEDEIGAVADYLLTLRPAKASPKDDW